MRRIRDYRPPRRGTPPDMKPEEARETWIRESIATARLAGDDEPERAQLEHEWDEITRGRHAAYLSRLAHGATTGRRILEMQFGGLDDIEGD